MLLVFGTSINFTILPCYIADLLFIFLSVGLSVGLFIEWFKIKICLSIRLFVCLVLTLVVNSFVPMARLLLLFTRRSKLSVEDWLLVVVVHCLDPESTSSQGPQHRGTLQTITFLCGREALLWTCLSIIDLLSYQLTNPIIQALTQSRV